MISRPVPGLSTKGSSTALLLGAAAVLGVVLFGRIPSQSLWAEDLANFAHGPAFASLTLIALAILRRGPTQYLAVPAEYALAIASAVALGAAVELVQAQIGGDAELDDVMRDALGALSACGFFTLFDRRLRESPQRGLVRLAGSLCGAVGVALLAWPLVESGMSYRQRDENFPVIADFSQWSSTYFLAGFGDVSYRREALPCAMSGHAASEDGLHVTVGLAKWWGLFIREPRRDWHAFDRVAFLIGNPTDASLVLELRIHDEVRQHHSVSGFVATITVPPNSWQSRSVPFASLSYADSGVRLDASRVQSLILARSVTSRAHEFYLTKIWLE